MTPPATTVDEQAATEPFVTAAPAPRGVRFAEILGVRDAGRALRHFTMYLPTQVIPAIAGFLVLPVLARELAPTELGVLTIAQTLITLGWTTTAAWLTSALMRELPAARERDDLRDFTATLWYGLGVTGVLMGLFSAGLLLSSLFSSAVGSHVGLVAAATVGLVAQNIAVSLFAASLRPRGYAVVDVLARTGGIVLGVILVFHGHKVAGYLTGVAVSSVAVGVLGLVASWPRVRATATRGPRHTNLGVWLRYGWPIAISGIGVWALLLADRYLLAAIETTGAVGVYALGSAIGSKAITIPAFAFYTAARPLLITAFEERGREEVERLMRSYSRIVLLVGLPTIAFAAATASPVVALLSSGYYSRYYAAAATVVPIIATAALIDSLGRIGNAGLTLAKRTRPLISASAIGLGVNVSANLALIPPFGINGAAIAAPIGSIALVVSAQVFAHRHARWRFPASTLLRAAVAAGAGYAVARLGMSLAEDRLPQIGLAAAAGGTTYLAVLLLLGERRAASP